MQSTRSITRGEMACPYHKCEAPDSVRTENEYLDTECAMGHHYHVHSGFVVRGVSMQRVGANSHALACMLCAAERSRLAQMERDRAARQRELEEKREELRTLNRQNAQRGQDIRREQDLAIALAKRAIEVARGAMVDEEEESKTPGKKRGFEQVDEEDVPLDQLSPPPRRLKGRKRRVVINGINARLARIEATMDLLVGEYGTMVRVVYATATRLDALCGVVASGSSHSSPAPSQSSSPSQTRSPYFGALPGPDAPSGCTLQIADTPADAVHSEESNHTGASSNSSTIEHPTDDYVA